MWKVIFIARSADHAQSMQQLLEANGFLVKLRGVGGQKNPSYEVCVPVSEAEDAYEVLCEHKFQC